VQQSLKKYNLADRPYFIAATRSRKPAISDSIVGADGMPAVIIDTPLVNANGEIFAHLGGVVYLSNLSKALSSPLIAPFDDGFLVDRQGMLIGHSDISQIDKAGITQSPSARLYQTRDTASDIQFGRWTDPQGISWLLTFTSCHPACNWCFPGSSTR
jgi:hypothetical protein